MIEVYIILVLMIIGALASVKMKSLLSSIIALGAVGMGLSLLFLLLGAPDLAITQLVVEILALVILIRATVGKDMVGTEEFSTRGFYKFCGIGILVLFLWLGKIALEELPPFGNAIMKMGIHYINATLKHTSAVNTVAAIILDFRGYDTLGEATVLFTAVLGVLMILRKNRDN